MICPFSHSSVYTGCIKIMGHSTCMSSVIIMTIMFLLLSLHVYTCCVQFDWWIWPSNPEPVVIHSLACNALWDLLRWIVLYKIRDVTDERKIKWWLSPSPDRKGTVFCCSWYIFFCLVLNDSSEVAFNTPSERLFYRLVEVNTESLAEPMPTACYKRFADCCAAVP